MDIEKLCKKFHKKIGKDKTLRITIEEGDTNKQENWLFGVIDKEVFEGIKNNSKIKKPKSFLKLSKGEGIEYSYVSFKMEVESKNSIN